MPLLDQKVPLGVIALSVKLPGRTPSTSGPTTWLRPLYIYNSDILIYSHHQIVIEAKIKDVPKERTFDTDQTLWMEI